MMLAMLVVGTNMQASPVASSAGVVVVVVVLLHNICVPKPLLPLLLQPSLRPM